eukprot:13539607-Ditylum_brightwellii.AAC.1
MTAPFVHHLQYHSMTNYTDEILRGTASSIPGVDLATQAFLDKCKLVTGDIPSQAKPKSFLSFLKECQRLRERTSSGPSIVTPAMVKTEALDPVLGVSAWHASNFLWVTGYASKRMRSGLDLLILKKAFNPRASRIRPILPFDIESNTHNKSLGRYAIEFKLLINDYFMIMLGLTGLQQPVVSTYDLVVHSIASLAYQRVGVPKAPDFAPSPPDMTWSTQFAQRTVTHLLPMVEIYGAFH